MGRNKFAVWVPFVLGFVDFFAVAIIIPLLAVNFKTKGYSPFLYGLAGTVYGTVQTLSGPLLGGYSDLHGRKICLLFSFYLSGIVYSGFFFFDTIIPFFILRSVLGFFKHSNTMCKAYLCDITPKAEQAAIMGRFNAISSAGFIVGPLIGSRIGTFENGCLVAAALFILSGVIAQVFLPDCPAKRSASAKSDPAPESVIDVCRSVNWPKYWDLFIARLSATLAVILYRSNLSFLLMTTHSLSAQEIGYVIALTGAVAAGSGFLAGPIIHMFKIDSVRLLVATGAVMTASLVLLCLSSTLSSLILFLVVFTASASLARVYGLDALLSRGTGSDIGLLQGVSQSVTSVSRGLAPLISGILQQLNQDLPAAVAALLAFLGTMLNVYSIKRTRVKVE
ncbi:major facilitator superfamily domain-containing protein 9-like [Galendromus occidentalis]|uniref:Major facilitator superfamily domain-containing protein 9-like n=1 Tax=Galendromus occidentalis TaxID=34638 RepID=A0AAJ7L6B9_9ACAR|nr:major facilitator superfamily domain-containing protein 9-like [Galendromus occidentalis]